MLSRNVIFSQIFSYFQLLFSNIVQSTLFSNIFNYVSSPRPLEQRVCYMRRPPQHYETLLYGMYSTALH